MKATVILKAIIEIEDIILGKSEVTSGFYSRTMGLQANDGSTSLQIPIIGGISKLCHWKLSRQDPGNRRSLGVGQMTSRVHPLCTC